MYHKESGEQRGSAARYVFLGRPWILNHFPSLDPSSMPGVWKAGRKVFLSQGFEAARAIVEVVVGLPQSEQVSDVRRGSSIRNTMVSE